MAQPVFIIEGSNVEDFADFVQEFNRVFCSRFNTLWHGNLDAFNDYLSWPEEKYTLVWRRADISRLRLGYAEMAKWLEERVQNCHPSNVAEMQNRLEAARREEGETMFDMLIAIISDNQEYVELRLE